jgi:isochorismate hydrolase
VVKDAIADFSAEKRHAALDANMPNYVSATVTTKENVFGQTWTTDLKVRPIR